MGKRSDQSHGPTKTSSTTLPALISLDYTDRAGDIILEVDASLDGWGGVLMQLMNEKRYLSRYKGRIWSNAERNYDATK